MKLIMESWNNFVNEEEAKSSFTTPDTGQKTTIEFLGMKTKHDQTDVNLRLDGKEDIETYTAYDIDSLADSVISDLEENYDGYWFLEDQPYNENYIKTFKANLLKVLEAIGADPEKDEQDRGSYRDRDTGGLY